MSYIMTTWQKIAIHTPSIILVVWALLLLTGECDQIMSIVFLVVLAIGFVVEEHIRYKYRSKQVDKRSRRAEWHHE